MISGIGKANNLAVRWLASGVLIASFSFIPFAWPLVIVGFVLLLELLRTSSVKQILHYGSLFCLTKSLIILAWGWSIYPLTWTGFEPGLVQILSIGIFWVCISFTLGISFLLSLLLQKFLYSFHSNTIFLFPITWLGAEVLGSTLYSVAMFGPGGTVNTYFSFGYVGYSLAETPILNSIAALAGVYSLTIFLVLVATTIFSFIRSHNIMLRTMTGLIALTISIIAHYEVTNRTIHTFAVDIAVIETDFGADSFNTIENYQTKLTETKAAVDAALKGSYDVILLPEDARFISNFENDASALTYLVNHTTSTPLIYDSARTTLDEDTIVQRAYVFDVYNSNIYTSDKQYLVPHGEFIPYVSGLVLNLLPHSQFKQKMTRDLRYKPGPHSTSDLPVSVPRILFCMESVSPVGIRKIHTEENIPLIVHPVSHSWFNNSSQLVHNLKQMLRTQALWNNVHIVEAGNKLQSTHYTNTGENHEIKTVVESGLWKLKELRI